jgi:hypothetical protein
VNEFVLTPQTGFQPLGVLSQAMDNARELAMARMESEADALGADGVIGVEIRARAYALPADVMEFVAVGTAIKGNAALRTPAGRPFTSHLSGQDCWTLIQHGWAPRAMVLGTCVYHVAHLSFWQVLQAAGQNTELGVYSPAVYDAREIVMTCLQYESAGGRRRDRQRGRLGLGRTRNRVLLSRHGRHPNRARRPAGEPEHGHAAHRLTGPGARSPRRAQNSSAEARPAAVRSGRSSANEPRRSLAISSIRDCLV